MLKKTCLLFLLLFLVLPADANEIVGKVVGVADGDTITVLENRTQYKIRLYGIDCPEGGQDFGTRAKQFTSKMVFGKQVKIIQKDIDRYKRIVGIVYVEDECLNEELLQNGMAWVYQYYCKIPVCNHWNELEAQAKDNKKGLWSHHDPIPPWDFRRKKRKMPLKNLQPVDRHM